MKKGLFVSIEGIEGSGKSTLIIQLHTSCFFGNDVLFTREPGGVPLAENLRALLIDQSATPMHAMTELLMIYAARNEHILQCIQPALAQGKLVITDRFFDASYAYQVGGRHLSEDQLAQLDAWVVGDCVPDLTILLNAPVDICLERVHHRGSLDRFDQETASFFAAAQQVYLQRAKQDPQRFLVIDSLQSRDDCFDLCVKAIRARLVA
jgi:dTMP kinase